MTDLFGTAFDNFREQVEAAGLTAKDCGNNHWQILGGALLVNYYPKRMKYYVAGTTKGVVGFVDDAIRATKKPPPVADDKDRRSNSSRYRNAKRRMLRRNPLCHWCGTSLTKETATLDHKIPLHRGGLDNPNNWVLACLKCNRHRGHDMPELEKE